MTFDETVDIAVIGSGVAGLCAGIAGRRAGLEVALLEKIAGPQAADALRAPFVLGDRTELVKLFQSAGVESVKVTTHRRTARFPSVRTMVEADLRGWLPAMGVVLGENQIGRILDEADRALSRYVTADGTVEFESPAHIVSGTKP